MIAGTFHCTAHTACTHFFVRSFFRWPHSPHNRIYNFTLTHTHTCTRTMSSMYCTNKKKNRIQTQTKRNNKKWYRNDCILTQALDFNLKLFDEMMSDCTTSIEKKTKMDLLKTYTSPRTGRFSRLNWNSFTLFFCFKNTQYFFLPSRLHNFFSFDFFVLFSFSTWFACNFAICDRQILIHTLVMW